MGPDLCLTPSTQAAPTFQGRYPYSPEHTPVNLCTVQKRYPLCEIPPARPVYYILNLFFAAHPPSTQLLFLFSLSPHRVDAWEGVLSVSRPSRLFVHTTRSIIRLVDLLCLFFSFVRSFPGAAGRQTDSLLIDGQQQQQHCYLQGAAY